MALGTEHTVKAFDADIGRLRGLIAEMGGRAEAALSDAMTALVQKDLDLAAQVVKKDRKIDELEVEIEKLTVQTIRSEEHTSELQSLMRISYAVFCLKKKK